VIWAFHNTTSALAQTTQRTPLYTSVELPARGSRGIKETYEVEVVRLAKYISRVAISLSVLLNVLLGGPSNQTFSARNYGWKREGKPNGVVVIDAIFLLTGNLLSYILRVTGSGLTITPQTHHCLESWVYWRVRKDVIHDIENGNLKG